MDFDFNSEEDAAIMDGRWFMDERNNFYIVPTDPTYENTGPDNQVMDALNKACRENNGVLPDDFDYEALGLTEVPDGLKRWNPTDGYYTA